MLLAFGLLAVLVIVVLWLRNRATAKPAHRRSQPSADVNPDGSGRFHAVSVRFGPGCCEGAKALHGLRFLSVDKPELPLPGCDASVCHCKLVHHRDRRQGIDRRSPYQQGYGGSATRIDADRRQGDRRRS